MNWISVADDMPKENQAVLVMTKNKWQDVVIFNGAEWTRCCDHMDLCEVTHWMSLPEPPKD